MKKLLFLSLILFTALACSDESETYTTKYKGLVKQIYYDDNTKDEIDPIVWAFYYDSSLRLSSALCIEPRFNWTAKVGFTYSDNLIYVTVSEELNSNTTVTKYTITLNEDSTISTLENTTESTIINYTYTPAGILSAVEGTDISWSEGNVVANGVNYMSEKLNYANIDLNVFFNTDYTLGDVFPLPFVGMNTTIQGVHSASLIQTTKYEYTTSNSVLTQVIWQDNESTKKIKIDYYN